MLKNELKMSNGSLVKGNVPKTHFFAPNSVTPNPKLMRPQKGTSSVQRLSSVKKWASCSKGFKRYGANKIWMKKKKNKKKCFTWGVRNLGAVEVVFVSKTWPLRLIRNYFAYARFCFSETMLKNDFFFWKIIDSWKFRKNIFANFFSTFFGKNEIA